ncbi:MAG: CBS domain-containing protein [Candidatus Moranbacteria bacterium]|nr:CBS domain-containing protein [Candidatus Moranbacteria bacterium]
MKIQDIMTKEVVSVRQDTTIIQVSKILEKHGFHGVPVVNDQNKLVGIITESDFFIKDMPDIFLPSYIAFLKRAEFAENLKDKEQEQAKAILEAKAADIMTKECITLTPESDINDLIGVFKNKKIHSVPIVDGNYQLVGIVTQADIIRLVSGN